MNPLVCISVRREFHIRSIAYHWAPASKLYGSIFLCFAKACHTSFLQGAFFWEILVSGARLNTARFPDLKPGPGCPGNDDDNDDNPDHPHHHHGGCDCNADYGDCKDYDEDSDDAISGVRYQPPPPALMASSSPTAQGTSLDK